MTLDYSCPPNHEAQKLVSSTSAFSMLDFHWVSVCFSVVFWSPWGLRVCLITGGAAEKTELGSVLSSLYNFLKREQLWAHGIQPRLHTGELPKNTDAWSHSQSLWLNWSEVWSEHWDSFKAPQVILMWGQGWEPPGEAILKQALCRTHRAIVPKRRKSEPQRPYL